MPQKMIRRKHSFLTWTIWEHEVWWSGEYFARIQHSWTRANPPGQPNMLESISNSDIIFWFAQHGFAHFAQQNINEFLASPATI